MCRSLVPVLVAAIVLSGCVSVHQTGRTCRTQSQVGQPSTRVLRHVVLFRFKQGTSAEQIRKIEDAFCALPGKIKAICGFEWGTDVSVENLSDGFTHCFIVTFPNEQARAEYLAHPEHKKFVELLSPYLDKALVIDYWARP